MSGGIYRIRNVATGKCYVGSAVNFVARWAVHCCLLRQGKHHSKRLQASWAKHGEAAFVFEPLFVCAPALFPLYEQRAIDGLEGYTNGYNGSADAVLTFLGRKHTPETRAKISAMHKGKPRPAHLIEKTVSKLRGRPLSMDHRAKLRDALLGAKHPEERTAKASAGKRAFYATPEGRAVAEGAGAKRKGFKHSPESKAKRLAAYLRAVAARKERSCLP